MTTYAAADWYELPLYYDIIYNQDTSHDADFLEGVMRRHVGRDTGSVLEPACGTGRLVAALAQRRHRVCGFDASDAMLTFARRRLAQARVQAHLKRSRLERFHYRRRFDLAHCLVSTFKYLPSDEAALAHLHRVADVLRPGGVYVLGLHLSDYAERRRTRERWVASRRGVHVTCNVQEWPADRRTRTQRLRSRLIVRERGRTRRYETYWQFRTYSRRQFQQLLEAVAPLEHVATYDFRHQIDEPARLDDGTPDKVLVLRRR
jgi:SAM-dependent methyltransferase